MSQPWFGNRHDTGFGFNKYHHNGIMQLIGLVRTRNSVFVSSSTSSSLYLEAR